MKRNNLVKLGALFLFGAILVLVWLKFVNLGEALQIIKSEKLLFVVLTGCAYIASNSIRIFRWLAILRYSQNVKSGRIYWLSWSATLLNYLIPIRIGEIYKLYYLNARHKLSYPRGLSTIIIDKSWDLSSVVILLLLGTVINFSLPDKVKYSLYVIFGIAAAGIVIIAALSALSRKRKFKSQILNKIFLAFSEAWQTFKDNFANKKLFFGSFALTIVSASIEALIPYFALHAVSVNIPYSYALFGALVRYLLFAIPMPPAQIGSTEVIWSLVYSGIFSYGASAVAAAALTSHTINILVNIILGLAGTASTGQSLSFIEKLNGKNS